MSTTVDRQILASATESTVPFGPSQKPWCVQVPPWAAKVVSGPLDNPIGQYPAVPPAPYPGVPEISYACFELPPEGMDQKQREQALGQLNDFEHVQHGRFTGFQTNEDEHYSDRLGWTLDMAMNNVGDPFSGGYYTLNSKFCERAVLDYFAALWNAPWPYQEKGEQARERYWGYVLNMGSTEGNLYGLFNGRDYLQGRRLISDQSKQMLLMPPQQDQTIPQFAYTPVAFYTDAAHYSIIKATRILQIPSFFEIGQRDYPGQCPINNGVWPAEVPIYQEEGPRCGCAKIDDLLKLVGFFVAKGYPPLIVLTVGTTWTGAYDDVPALNLGLQALGQQYPWLWQREVHYPDGGKDQRRGFWLHIDAALGGAYLPFLEMAKQQGHIKETVPQFDFRIPAVMSVVCSGHKWIGCPVPSGVFMTRRCYQLQPPDTAGYIGSPDTTLGGSRNAMSPITLWDYFSRMSYTDNVEKALQCLARAQYLQDQLHELQTELRQRFGPQVDLWIGRSELSLAVRFRQVNPDIGYRWTVDGEEIIYPCPDGQQERRQYAHIYAMHSLRVDMINTFIEELRVAARTDWHHAFPCQIDGQDNPAPMVPSAHANQHWLRIAQRGKGLR